MAIDPTNCWWLHQEACILATWDAMPVDTPNWPTGTPNALCASFPYPPTVGRIPKCAPKGKYKPLQCLLSTHIPVAQVSGTGRRHANLSISVDYPQENKWEALSFGGSPPGLALRDPKKACILRIPPKEGTRGVKWAHPSEKSERASESLQGWLVKAFLSQSQLLKTSGGNCSFKC